jgi:Family of unknown function (DUF5681)
MQERCDDANVPAQGVSMPTDNTAPKHLTPWRPGQSGNPSGRPKGARNKITLVVEALLDDEAETITRKAIEVAKSGDMTAPTLD